MVYVCLSLEETLETQEKMSHFFSISRGLPGGVRLSQGTEIREKEAALLRAYFSKHKMKLSSRQHFFTKII